MSIRKAKRILKKLGYRIIRSKGNGVFTVDDPNGQRLQIFGAPVVDIGWFANMKHYEECQRQKAMDTGVSSNYTYTNTATC